MKVRSLYCSFTVGPESMICLLLTVHLQLGRWLSLLEADLTNYAGLYVSGVRGESSYCPLRRGSWAADVGRNPRPARRGESIS